MSSESSETPDMTGEISVDIMKGMFSGSLGNSFLKNAFKFNNHVTCSTSSNIDYKTNEQERQRNGQVEIIEDNAVSVLKHTHSLVPGVRSSFKEKEWSFFVGWWSD